MRRSLLLLALVACDVREPVPPPPPTWVVPPPAPAWPLGEEVGRFGRSEAPQPARPGGLTGDVQGALALPAPWPVPGAGPARAIVAGLAGGKPALELVEIDRGRVVWRDTTCGAPVAGVTEQVVVCGDAHGTRAVGLDGKPRWHAGGAFLAMTGDRVVTGAGPTAVVLDATSGAEQTRVALPAGIAAETLIASCGNGRELFAATPDGKLARIADGAKGAPAVAWAVPAGSIAGIDACTGTTVLVTAAGDGGTSLVAIARDTGKLTGRVDGVRGYWPARDGSDRLEISTPAGVGSWTRDLASAPVPVALPVLAELLASRGDRRLVRATRHTAALLDRAGVRAYLPLAQLGAVLGDEHVLAGSWLGSPGEHLRRYALPPAWPRPLRVPVRGPGAAVPSELRDLPALALLDEGRAIARATTTADAIAAVALDPDDPRALYALTVAHDAGGAGRVDLAARAWTWQRADACAPGTPVGLAVATDVVACAGSRGVRATGKDGAPRWDWPADHVDAVEAAGDLVLAYDADRLAMLDARDGHLLAELASDDGARMRAAVLEVAGTALVVTYERGRLVARLPGAAMLPVWSLAVDGVVAALEPAGDGVLVELEDGDAYRIDARTADVVALPGLDLGWHAATDLITGTATGEPIPPEHMPVPPPVIPKPRPLHDSPENPPPVATPWTVPPPGPPAWQLQIFELTGGVRARNDYALAPPVAQAGVRGPADSPILVGYGPGAREVLVLDPRRGDPLRRVRLAEDATLGAAFATVVDGKPVAGVVLPDPLRVVVF